MIRIEADFLIPGKGDPIKNGCVITNENKIHFAGSVEDAPHIDVSETINVPVVMPGMWECHGHFLGVKTSNLEELALTPIPVLAARVVKDAETVINAGFTSVRGAGGFGVYLARVIEEGSVSGPTIYAPGAILSQTGGHGDLHRIPLDWIHNVPESFPLELVDGIPECIKGVRKQLRLGARVIKICASGGVLSQLDHPIHQQFRDDEILAIVEEAKRADRIVMAHCHGKPGIMAALRNGVHTIEHGTFLDEEVADLMNKQHALLVPTRFIIDQLLKYAPQAQLPDYALKKLQAISDQHMEALKLAIKKGVLIAMGTDIVNSGLKTAVPWGKNGKELEYYVQAGMSPLQAIETATYNGPLTLGPQGPKSGFLKEGYDADIITLTKNPLDDIKVLGEPENISYVIKSGKIVKPSM